jgi:hypothetical protein
MMVVILANGQREVSVALGDGPAHSVRSCVSHASPQILPMRFQWLVGWDWLTFFIPVLSLLHALGLVPTRPCG